MLFYVGPLIFAIPANRKAEIMLPASVTEKITFYLGYTFIAVPAFISVLWLTCIGIGCIFSDHGNVQALYNEGMSLYGLFTFSETGTPLSYLTDAMLSILMPATSLYAIIKARRLRVLWGIGGVAIAFFTKILIAIAVIVSTIVIYALADTPETGEEDASINYLYMINPLISIICFVIGIIIIVLTAKMLARRTA